MALTERDRALLDFERLHWKYPAAKEAAIMEQFDLTATRYFQILNELIDRPEALEVDAQLVNRLRRLRDARRRQRAPRPTPAR